MLNFIAHAQWQLKMPAAVRSTCEKKRIIRIIVACLFLSLVVLLGAGRSFRKLKVTTSKSVEVISSIKVVKNLKLLQSQGRNEISTKALALNISLNTSAKNGTTGFVVVSHFSDQMTGASLNLLSLQCWASKLHGKVRVVEPFLIKGSKFGFDLPRISPDQRRRNDSDYEPPVRLRDMLDIESWENATLFPSLISWEDFLKEAPRNLILISPETPRRSNHNRCKENFVKPAYNFAKDHNFTVVREICLKRILYSAREFEDLVYGSYQPGNSVVLFNYWGGIVDKWPKAYRIGISDMDVCDRLKFSEFLFRRSETVRRDSQQYMEHYMPLAVNSGYVSVMFRSERLGLSHSFKDISYEEKLLTLTRCVRNITDYVDKLRAQYNIHAVFLAMDCRRQGSMVFRRLSGPAYMSRKLVDQVTLSLYQKLYGNSSSLEDWDDSFDRIASFKTAGYLAQLQKSLAANGSCLLTAGGGNFQLSAERLYHEIHRSSNALCAFQVPGCM